MREEALVGVWEDDALLHHFSHHFFVIKMMFDAFYFLIVFMSLAGKGHEDYQEIKGVKHHFDDKEVVREMMQ